MTGILQKIKQNFLPVLLFAILLIVGLTVYRDYGISWDEPIQRDVGVANVQYIKGLPNSLAGMNDRFYGPIYAVFLIGVEKIAAPATLRDVFFLRHLCTFLTFFIGMVFFFFLSKNIFKHTSTALLCSVALILSPRIFDNAFYNSKDIPLLVFFILSFTLLFRYVETRKTVLLILLAVFSAITTTIRLAGILIPVLAILVMVQEFFSPSTNFKRKISGFLPKLAVFLLLFLALTFLFWPILWSNPVGHFMQALKEMSRFNWDHPVLFMGNLLPASQLPWYYPIVWILISTPIVYSCLFMVGLVQLIAGIRTSAGRFFEKQQLKLFLIAAWFFIPLIMVFLLKSVLYDSWRHLFFIYPAFLLLAFWGFEKTILLLKNKFGRINLASAALILVLGVSFISTALFMIRAHPYEQLYFNRLAGKNLSEIATRYDMDYWGLAYRSGLEYISHSDPSPGIKYVSETSPGSYTFILPQEDAKRLIWIENEKEASYLITNYRWKKSYPSYQEVYSVQVEGVKILSVFKLK